MSENPFPVGTQYGLEIVGRIEALITGRTIADLEIEDVKFGPIDQVVRPSCSWKSSAHAWSEDDLAVIGDQGRLTQQYVNELVLLAVPMQEGRFSTGKKPRQVHAKIL